MSSSVSSSLSFTYCTLGSAVRFTLTPYPLELRTAFGTSHSSSTRRENALLQLTFAPASESASSSLHHLNSYGEVGLPPRKTGCYEATFASLHADLSNFQQFLQAPAEAASSHAQADDKLYDPFTSVPEGYFQSVRKEIASATVSTASHPFLPALLDIFRLLDLFLTSKRKAPTDAAFCCLVELSLFDAWGRMRKQQICEMIGTTFDNIDASTPENAGNQYEELTHHRQPRSFYTVGMDTLDKMLTNLDFGLQYTSLIKIKVDDNIENTKTVLENIVGKLKEARPDGDFWISVDANAAWKDAAIAHKFLEILLPFREHIAMVEQPFPLFRACPTYVDAKREGHTMQVVADEYVDLPNEVLASWLEVSRVYAQAGLLIYADESICNAKDLKALRGILHGINAKLEKTGGIRRALELIREARQSGVMTWIGCMVGSTLNSSLAAQLLPVAGPDHWGDLDGSLLTSTSSDMFEGGMRWGPPISAANASEKQKMNGEMHLENKSYGGCGAEKKKSS